MKRGLFITIEGPDGCGKSTQIALLNTFLTENGLRAVVTREPGGTAISEKIRELILDRENSEMGAMTEALLYAASRAQHVAQVIRPALLRGETVICDRFIDSSVAYQGYGRGLGGAVRAINEYAVGDCIPDVTFLMKLDPAIGRGRIGREQQDRLEAEDLRFHREVYRGYLELEQREPERIIGIDADRPAEEIGGQIREYVKRLLLEQRENEGAENRR